MTQGYEEYHPQPEDTHTHTHAHLNRLKKRDNKSGKGEREKQDIPLFRPLNNTYTNPNTSYKEGDTDGESADKGRGQDDERFNLSKVNR